MRRPSPVPPPEPPPAPVADQAPPPQPTRWALDTPPANESWWRNPIVLVAAIASVVLGSGVASWRFFISSSETVSAIHALPQQHEPAPETTPAATSPATAEPDEATTVAAVVAIVRRSEVGLAALRRLDYAAALENRRGLVAALDRLDVPSQPARLAAAVATLRAALAASARADRAHIACGCDERLPEDVTAHGLKHRFAAEFVPYARRHLGHPIDPDRI